MTDPDNNVRQLRPVGITATDLRSIDKGALVSIFTLHIHAWNLSLVDCKLFRKGDNEWVALPSTTFTKRDGKTVYKTLVEFSDKEAAERFQSAALNAVRCIS